MVKMFWLTYPHPIWQPNPIVGEKKIEKKS
jgi:hypothetical protein